MTAPKEKKEKPELTRLDLYELFGCSSDTERIELCKALPPPSGKRGKASIWLPEALGSMLHGLFFDQEDETGIKLKKAILSERRRLLAAQADRQRLAMEREAGHLIPEAEVTAYARQMAMAIKAQVMAIASSVAVRCAALSSAVEVQEVLEARCADALTELERWRWDTKSWRTSEVPLDGEGEGGEEGDDDGDGDGDGEDE